MFFSKESLAIEMLFVSNPARKSSRYPLLINNNAIKTNTKLRYNIKVNYILKKRE